MTHAISHCLSLSVLKDTGMNSSATSCTIIKHDDCQWRWDNHHHALTFFSRNLLFAIKRRDKKERERKRKRQPLLPSCFFSSHNLLMCKKLDEVMCFFWMWSQEFSLICKFKILELEGRSTCATHQREMVFRISWCGFQQWARVAIIIMGGDV